MTAGESLRASSPWLTMRGREGELRILSEIDDGASTVTVVKIGHRRDGYR